jgi:tetratricopeptide (TPR) repeat protein
MMSRYLTPFLCLLLIGTPAAADSAEQLQLLIEQKEYARAMRSGEKLLLQNPDNTRARFLTAYAYQMSGHDEKAISLYETVIRENPSLPEPRNNLAMIYLAQGDYDKSSQLLVEALNTHSSYATAYANLSRVYKGIASEAYRRAVSESSEPAKYTHDIELTAITSLDSIPPAPVLPASVAIASKTAADPVTLPKPEPAVQALAKTEAITASAPQTVINAANHKTLLIENVRNWAGAWSSKEFDAYTSAYVADYRAKFSSHAGWVKHRRSRIVRPGKLEVVVSDFTVKLRGQDRASVDFVQAFSSPGYSDRVVKRLDFRRIDSQWKISAERVLSVL